MELRHFKLVKAIVDEGTMTRAARKLYVSQSALSHQLRELEVEFGAPLFHRHKKRLVLTDLGRRVLSSAGAILCEVERVRTDARRLVTGEGGRLRFTTSRYTCYHWLPCLMKSFRMAFPDVELSLIGSATSDPVGRLLAGELDVAIVTDRTAHPRLLYKKLRDDELLVLVPNGHPWQGRSHVSARDFAGVDLIIYDVPGNDSLFVRKVLVPSSVKPRSLTRLPLTDAMIHMVMAGMGVAILGQWTLEPYLDEFATVRITRGGLHRSWYAVTLRDSHQPLYVRGFIEYLSKEPRE